MAMAMEGKSKHANDYLTEVDPDVRYERVQWQLSNLSVSDQCNMIMRSEEGNINLMELAVFEIDHQLILLLLRILTTKQKLQCCYQHNLFGFALNTKCKEIIEVIVVVYEHLLSESLRCNDCGKCRNCSDLRGQKKYLKKEIHTARKSGSQWSSQTIESFDSLLLDRYTIPQNQDDKNMWAFVCYNTYADDDDPSNHREGAEQEAGHLIQCLKEGGFKIKELKDWTNERLRNWIRRNIREIRKNCSVLYFFVMSHGDDAVIHDINREPEEINNLLLELEMVSANVEENRHKLHARTPCVVVIQACQGIHQFHRFEHTDDVNQQNIQNLFGIEMHSPPAETDAAKHPNSAAREELKAESSVKLQRPHTALVLASRPGYTAQRDFFIPLFANELREADGETELLTYIRRISDEMSTHNSAEHSAQVPSTTTLLRLDLVLPATEAVRKKKEMETIETWEDINISDNSDSSDTSSDEVKPGFEGIISKTANNLKWLKPFQQLEGVDVGELVEVAADSMVSLKKKLGVVGGEFSEQCQKYSPTMKATFRNLFPK